jgi:hypothetical protein
MNEILKNINLLKLLRVSKALFLLKTILSVQISILIFKGIKYPKKDLKPNLNCSSSQESIKKSL